MDVNITYSTSEISFLNYLRLVYTIYIYTFVIYRFSVISQGQEWRDVRLVLDKQMLKPSRVATYTQKVYDVNTDFLQRLRSMRREDMSVPDMDKELFNWSLES